MKKSNKQYLFEMVAAAVLVALKVVLDRFLSYNVWNQRFGFSFIAVAFAGAMLGAPWAMAVGGLGDIVGALLFPTGPYFPGFTLTAVLTALCTALFIRKNASLLRVTLSVLINQFFGSVILNSVWISILYGKGFVALIPSRILQSGIMTVLQITLIYLLFGEKSVIRRRLSRLPAFS
ncbi:MAG: folate family ECF transporter S component [Acutalibacteraceae bacterium]|nr:folate family ECF transporter S component [Acutalibacteraceae bacterium]